MKQADLRLNLSVKRTRKRGRPPFAVGTMLRIHFMQQWFGLSHPAMGEALHDTLIRKKP